MSQISKTNTITETRANSANGEGGKFLGGMPAQTEAPRKTYARAKLDKI